LICFAALYNAHTHTRVESCLFGYSAPDLHCETERNHALCGYRAAYVVGPFPHSHDVKLDFLVFFVFRNSRTHTHTHTHAFLAHTHTHSLSHTFAYSHLHVHACVYVGTWKNQRAHPERTSWIGDEESPFAIVSVAPLSLYVTSRGLPSFIIILAVIVIDNGPDATKDFCVPALFRCSNSTHRAPQPRAGSW